MKKRQFKLDRLYKLVKVIVIILFIFFLIRTWLSWQSINYYNSPKAIANIRTCHDIWQGDKNELDCSIDSFFKPAHQANEDFTQSVLMVFLIPILFFGTTWSYKYLFPIKRQT